jgi:uncharacterized protein YndB with AHSA1/START domain
VPSRTVDIAAPRDRVFDAVGDARTYPEWLVGARRIRRVDDDWPREGSSFHHAVGAGPIEIKDRTTVVRCDRPGELRLRAHIGPLGAAFVRFVIEDSPEPGKTRLRLDEEPDSGVVRMAWTTLGRPLLRLSIWGRNAVSLENLKSYIEGGGSASADGAAGDRSV